MHAFASSLVLLQFFWLWSLESSSLVPTQHEPFDNHSCFGSCIAWWWSVGVTQLATPQGANLVVFVAFWKYLCNGCFEINNFVSMDLPPVQSTLCPGRITYIAEYVATSICIDWMAAECQSPAHAQIREPCEASVGGCWELYCPKLRPTYQRGIWVFKVQI